MNREELYEKYIIENLSRKECAEYFGVSETTIKRKVKEYNIIKTQSQKSELMSSKQKIHLKREELENLYIEKNLTLNECAEVLNVSSNIVKRRLKDFGIKKPSYKFKKVHKIHARQTENSLKKRKETLLKKYGVDNFDHEILERDIPTPQEANEREKYWIEQFDSFKNSYNATIGGSGATGHKVNEKARKKNSEAHKGNKNMLGKHHNEETRKLISERQKGKHNSPRTEFKKGNISWTKGKPMLPHIKEALRQANLGKTPYNKGKFGGENILSRPIVQYDLEGNFIKKWPSAHEIHEIYGCDRSSIARCCRGEYKQFIGFVWFYEDNVDLNKIKIAKKSQEKRFRKIDQFDLSGNYIKTYDTIAQAEKEIGLNHSDIICCCQGKRKQAGGYIWRYKK